ncbi:MAG TPA: phage tail sheath subtilisin-like domain-containing protein, partial [Caldilineaceae bacterium]|nr:phage tail sheath subtilisin-like domain-containing protein [Caldilineaceae bacterium]
EAAEGAAAAAEAARGQEVAANNAASAVQEAHEGLVAALAALAAADAADRLARAEEVAAAATAASEAAEAAANTAEAAVEPITAAARAARLAVRAGAANPVGMLRARFPGAMGNVRLTITTRLAQNSFSVVNNLRRLSQVKHQDLVWLSSGENTGLFVAELVQGAWRFVRGETTLPLAGLAANAQVRVVTWAVEVLAPGAFAQPQTWENLTAHPDRLQDGISNVFAEEILNRERELETPIVLTPVGNDPVALAGGLIGPAGLAALPAAPASGIITRLQLAGGNDGVRPTAAEYIGRGGEDDLEKSGLIAFEDLEEISIVAAPGLSFGAANGYQNEARQATQAVITHCERMRYRVAVLDSPDNLAISQVRADRAILDTTRAAYYYPWIRIQDPVTRQPIHVPPSGFIAGIYARNDVEQGVHKAPANEVVLGAIGLEVMLNTAQQEILNPLGINCVRWFENRGIRVWGARTLSSDPEWKYLNIRRYFAYLERSIERATQWAVFEPNGETLWANVRRAVEDFLYNEWVSDRLAGLRPVEAFFVQCDRGTMTQNDLDNGRMICLIGVAPLYPAEFVIFRIGQWTADRRS